MSPGEDTGLTAAGRREGGCCPGEEGGGEPNGRHSGRQTCGGEVADGLQAKGRAPCSSKSPHPRGNSGTQNFRYFVILP